MKTGILTLVALSLFTMLAATSDVSAQGRGRYNRGWDRKCEKFVNCHDARDGRWDGRGPRRSVWSRRWHYSPYYRDQYYYSPYYRDQYFFGGYPLRRVYRRTPERVYIRTYRRW